MNPKDYEGREQAYVKHWVLEHYLQVLALKIGQYRPGTTFNYIDGFSGPFDHGVSLDNDRPTSPYVALTQLRDAREQLRTMGNPVVVRGLFVESKRSSYERLQTLLARWTDLETASCHGTFEEHIGDAVQFAQSGAKPFAFVFIDPTGWSGYALHTIAPLLRVEPGEVLINFMLKDITRFIDHEDSAALQSFEELFGQRSEEYRAKWRGMVGPDREDAIVAAYCERIREVGKFAYCASTIVVNPINDRTHYHLIYATRSRKGLIAFRDVERRALGVQQTVRAVTKEKGRVIRTGQPSLFDAKVVDTSYLGKLHERYCERALTEVLQQLSPVGTETRYEQLLDCALQWPTVSKSDLGRILEGLVKDGRIEFLGLNAGERRPKLASNHRARRVRE